MEIIAWLAPAAYHFFFKIFFATFIVQPLSRKTVPGSQYVGTSRNKHKPSENKTARDLGKRAVALIRLLSRFVRNRAYY